MTDPPEPPPPPPGLSYLPPRYDDALHRQHRIQRIWGIIVACGFVFGSVAAFLLGSLDFRGGPTPPNQIREALILPVIALLILAALTLFAWRAGKRGFLVGVRLGI